MNASASLQPSTPTIILIGGPFTADTGEYLDSRQPFPDDPLSDKAQTALASSELWWLTTASLVTPLVNEAAGDSFALVVGARTLIAPRPDGTMQRRRLALSLPGGVRPQKPTGKWQLGNMAELWGATPGEAPPSVGGPITPLPAVVVVETDGWYWRNAASRFDYAEFERLWLAHNNLIIIAPHTHAATTYLDGYQNWVANDRQHSAQTPPPTPEWDAHTPALRTVIPVQAGFQVTAAVQHGKWVDATPLEAARSLLQARFDLRIGIWDLVTNHTLRSTLLKETPPAAAPVALATQSSDALKRETEWRATRKAEQQLQERKAPYYDAVRDLVATLDSAGWKEQLPGFWHMPFFRFNPAGCTRFISLATAPNSSATEIPFRHPGAWPGCDLLWLQLDIEPNPRRDSAVRLVIPAPLSSLDAEIFGPFIAENTTTLQQFAGPNGFVTNRVDHDDGRVTYDLMSYPAGPEPPHIEDFLTATGVLTHAGNVNWQQRISHIAATTSVWLQLFSPLSQFCRQIIETQPDLGHP